MLGSNSSWSLCRSSLYPISAIGVTIPCASRSTRGTELSFIETVLVVLPIQLFYFGLWLVPVPGVIAQLAPKGLLLIACVPLLITSLAPRLGLIVWKRGALGGLTILHCFRHRSTNTCTSSSVSSISTFKDSSRSLPLNDSRYPFSRRLPGSMYSVFTPRPSSHCRTVLAVNSEPRHFSYAFLPYLTFSVY